LSGGDPARQAPEAQRRRKPKAVATASSSFAPEIRCCCLLSAARSTWSMLGGLPPCDGRNGDRAGGPLNNPEQLKKWSANLGAIAAQASPPPHPLTCLAALLQHFKQRNTRIEDAQRTMRANEFVRDEGHFCSPDRRLRPPVAMPPIRSFFSPRSPASDTISGSSRNSVGKDRGRHSGNR
jgi:hypothetical protein